MALDRSLRVCILIVASSVHCGSRTEIADTMSARAAPIDAGRSRDASSLDAFSSDAVPLDAPAVDASACVPAPAGGITIATLPDTVISVALAVAAGTVYVGTAANGDAGALYVGAVSRVPALGGPSAPIPAPAFNFGALASDGARLYYAQTSGRSEGPGSAIYQVVGVASINLATDAVQPIATLSSPWSTSSNPNSTMIAATTAYPGVFWIGGGQGAQGASTLSAWSSTTKTVTTLATGQSLSGLAVDATGVYWADSGGDQGITVYRGPLGGGAPTTLVNVPGGTHGVLLGVSTTDVIFVSDYLTAPILAVSKTGGAARSLVTATSAWVNAFAWVDDLYLYWIEPTGPSTLQRVPVAGGPVEVVPTQGQVQSLAFDACNVYIGSQGLAQVVALPK